MINTLILEKGNLFDKYYLSWTIFENEAAAE